MIEITLDLLIKYLGPPERKKGSEYVWQCPYCLDSHKDNLTYNAQKGIVYCFASEGEHSRQLIKNIISNESKNNPNAWKEFLENKYQNIKKISKEKEEKASIIYEDEKQLEFVNYAAINMISLMGNLEALTVLLEKRGITKETAMNVVLGYDTQKRRWVIPTIKYSTEYTAYLIGFEYRPLDFSKDGISREKGTPTGLAQINAFNDQKNLIIVEGYFDGYVLYQHLTEQNKINEYHIVTCSNGVSGLLNQLSVINFDKYEKCYLLIDNDETSIPIATKICNKYPKIINLSTKMFKNCGCKDFNEHYLKCIYNKRISSRYNLDDIKKIKDYYEDTNIISIEKDTLLNVLSQGEKRALYILNIIFEIEARKELKQPSVLIIDDIADSFDYKNKYAIIEYLKEITTSNNFYQLILTHNFDFYRTTYGRLGIPRANRLQSIKTRT